MSNFTLVLIIIGGLILAGVIAHGAWNTRRGRVRQADAPLPSASDAGQRSEDFMAGPQGNAKEPHFDETLNANESEMPTESEFSAHDEAFTQVMALAIQADKKPRLDPLIDSMAIINFEHEVSGEALLAALPATRRVGSKPVYVEGQPVGTQEWEFPTAGRRYLKAQAGVQMANRTGAMSEIEFSEFVVKVQSVADVLNGSTEFPEMSGEVQKARELDQFAAAHDAQLSVFLFSRRVAWSAGFVQQCASRIGFVAGSLPGRMVLPAPVSNLGPLIALNFDSQAAMSQDLEGPGLRQLSLTLDVPQVDRAENPFALMRQMADLLAASMDAVVADEQGRPVNADTLNLIEADLQQLYDRLESRDLGAGTALARRLFS